jgi:hypothetical protein
MVLGTKLAAVKEFTVLLHTAGIESQAFATRDSPFAQQVIEAINRAIIARG